MGRRAISGFTDIVVACVESVRNATLRSYILPLIGEIKCPKTTLASEGEAFTASVEGRDPDGDKLTWRWALLSDTDNYELIITNTSVTLRESDI